MGIPSVRFNHLIRLTDDTGILEHALMVIPRRKEGYSTDDQARALWVCLEWMNLSTSEEQQRLEHLAEIYLSFLLWAQKDDGHFHNNFAYDRSREPESPSDDCLGRCLWACAKVMTYTPTLHFKAVAEHIFHKAWALVEFMQYPRGWAYALAAFALLERSGIDLELKSHIATLAKRLASVYHNHSNEGWKWYGDKITYSNALLPWGMFWAYEIEEKKDWLNIALESLDFLIEKNLNDSNQIRPIGNLGWCNKQFKAQWDQQPIDVMKLALASDKAYELTGKQEYKSITLKCLAWFYGDNDLGVVMINKEDGSCYDGLQANGANQNCGAEAVISYLLTEAICHRFSRCS